MSPKTIVFEKHRAEKTFWDDSWSTQGTPAKGRSAVSTQAGGRDGYLGRHTHMRARAHLHKYKRTTKVSKLKPCLPQSLLCCSKTVCMVHWAIAFFFLSIWLHDWIRDRKKPFNFNHKFQLHSPNFAFIHNFNIILELGKSRKKIFLIFFFIILSSWPQSTSVP